MDLPYIKSEPEVILTEDECEREPISQTFDNQIPLIIPPTPPRIFPAASLIPTKCGEILVSDGKFLIYCCICDTNFMNFHYFSMHYFENHQIPNGSMQSNSSIYPEVFRNPHNDGRQRLQLQKNRHQLQQSFIPRHSIPPRIPNSEPPPLALLPPPLVPLSNDEEIIRIGGCQFTVKKMPSTENLNEIYDDIQPKENSTNYNSSRNEPGGQTYFPQIPDTAEQDDVNRSPLKVIKLEKPEDSQNSNGSQSDSTIEFRYKYCNLCNRGYTDRQEYAEHFSKYHSEELPFMCLNCGKGFRSKESLTEHVRSIHERIKPFKCFHCEKAFHKSSALTIHVREHTGERPFKCGECEKTFKSKGALNEHKFIHTGTKRYHCQFCDKKFLHSSSFRKHERLHTGERPYKCELCESSFRTLDILKEHMGKHNSAPFKCKICPAQFSCSAHLTRHYRVHNGIIKQRPTHKCYVCEKVLTRKSHLRNHLIKFHKINIEDLPPELMPAQFVSLVLNQAI